MRIFRERGWRGYFKTDKWGNLVVSSEGECIPKWPSRLEKVYAGPDYIGLPPDWLGLARLGSSDRSDPMDSRVIAMAVCRNPPNVAEEFFATVPMTYDVLCEVLEISGKKRPTYCLVPWSTLALAGVWKPRRGDVRGDSVYVYEKGGVNVDLVCPKGLTLLGQVGVSESFLRDLDKLANALRNSQRECRLNP